MVYQLRRYPDAFSFRVECEEFLLLREVENSLMIGLASNLERGLIQGDEGTLFGSVWRGESLEGAFLRTKAIKGLILSHMKGDCAGWLAENLDVSLCECNGMIPAAQIFAETFALKRRLIFQVEMFQGVYRLDDVDGHYPFEGEGMVEARDLPLALVQSFVEGFLWDCFPDSKQNVPEVAREIIERHNKQNALFAWRNAGGEIVSIAAKSRESRDGTTISLVYTPAHDRKKGYAGRLVAALSRKCLGEGKRFCTLYTDLMNPTSNSVYRKVGYHKIAEGLHYKFVEKGS